MGTGLRCKALMVWYGGEYENTVDTRALAPVLGLKYGSHFESCTFQVRIRGPALKLLKSYLSDRTQYVIYDGIQSTTLPISCGVPQGSILGPLLFIITLNDIGNVSEFLYTILYADDTCVLLNGKDYMNLVNFLNSELNKLSTWLCENKLSLNVQKTYFMVFHRAKMKIVTPIDVTLMIE